MCYKQTNVKMRLRPVVVSCYHFRNDDYNKQSIIIIPLTCTMTVANTVCKLIVATRLKLIFVPFVSPSVHCLVF